MGTGNLKPTDRFMVRVSSDVYGVDAHGPYDSLDKAREAKARLKLAADMLNDGVDRHYEIILLSENTDEGSVTYTGKLDCPVIAEPSREPIIITVEGGVIQSIDNIPPGQVVQVWDFDTECAEDEEELQENEQGERFYLSEYVGA